MALTSEEMSLLARAAPLFMQLAREAETMAALEERSKFPNMVASVYMQAVHSWAEERRKDEGWDKPKEGEIGTTKIDKWWTLTLLLRELFPGETQRFDQA